MGFNIVHNIAVNIGSNVLFNIGFIFGFNIGFQFWVQYLGSILVQYLVSILCSISRFHIVFNIVLNIGFTVKKNAGINPLKWRDAPLFTSSSGMLSAGILNSMLMDFYFLRDISQNILGYVLK